MMWAHDIYNWWNFLGWKIGKSFTMRGFSLISFMFVHFSPPLDTFPLNKVHIPASLTISWFNMKKTSSTLCLFHIEFLMKTEQIFFCVGYWLLMKREKIVSGDFVRDERRNTKNIEIDLQKNIKAQRLTPTTGKSKNVWWKNEKRIFFSSLSQSQF